MEAGEMGADIGGGVEGEVTRVAAVKYLQGALGHTVASITVLLAAAVLLAAGRPTFGWLAIGIGALLSANGASIWAWDRLQAYFAPDETSDSEPTRSLTASPLSTESVVEMKAGAVMTLAFVGVLFVGWVALQYLDPQVVGVTAAGSLAVGNVAALLRVVRADG